MKARIERERIPPSEDPQFHLKLGRGSLSDVEWTVQLLQLRTGTRGTGDPWTPWTASSVPARSARPDAAALREAYRFCVSTRNRWHLVGNYLAGAGGVVGSGADALPRQPELQSAPGEEPRHDPDRAARVVPAGDAAQPQSGRARLLRPVTSTSELFTRSSRAVSAAALRTTTTPCASSESSSRVELDDQKIIGAPGKGRPEADPVGSALGNSQRPAHVLGSPRAPRSGRSRTERTGGSRSIGPRCGHPIRRTRDRPAPGACSWRRDRPAGPAQPPVEALKRAVLEIDVVEGAARPPAREMQEEDGGEQEHERQEQQQQRDVVGDKGHRERQN